MVRPLKKWEQIKSGGADFSSSSMKLQYRFSGRRAEFDLDLYHCHFINTLTKIPFTGTVSFMIPCRYSDFGVHVNCTMNNNFKLFNGGKLICSI